MNVLGGCIVRSVWFWTPTVAESKVLGRIRNAASMLQHHVIRVVRWTYVDKPFG